MYLPKQGDTIDNNKLTEIFKCSPQGGMRRSIRTKSLVLIYNHLLGIYDDKWEGDILYYTGMGKKGNQSLEFMQNKTLKNSNHMDIKVYLFEVFEPKKYFFQGEVELIQSPYSEDQRGRKVYIFPLRLKNNKKRVTPFNRLLKT